ncbi:hypothetical protein G7054_g1232 [Neopestalotiopsis clavispora]|nr:hypothetical protein G7054_g1232 [Neopestalotiopsis clavispora]
MATSVEKGKLVPPLNITAPTPSLDINNFQWKTLDDKLNPPPFDGTHVDVFAIADKSSVNGQKVFSREAAAAQPLNGAVQLPPQLAQQIATLDTKKKLDHVFFPLDAFQGAYTGNGFNMIFRPKTLGPKGLEGLEPGTDPDKVKISGKPPDDNILELNLTTEQLSFGGTIDNIPNRGSQKEEKIDLRCTPYLQTVQDVTNPSTGKGDHVVRDWGIHFEPGVWLKVPPASFQGGKGGREIIVRMASIPHGTTINAQGFVPPRRTDTVNGGEKGGPKIEDIDTTPFTMGDPSAQIDGFTSMAEENNEDLRIPRNLDMFGKNHTQMITTAIIKNPNLVLQQVAGKLKIDETITFDVSTGPEDISKQTAEEKAKIPAAKVALNKAAADKPNGGGTANIAFLEGESGKKSPNAQAVRMTAKYWIERVMYDITIPGEMPPRSSATVQPRMPDNCTAPIPRFNIIAGFNGHPKQEDTKVFGIQIQVSQNVTLNFANLSWPHVSVSTLVPSDPQDIDLSLPTSEWGKL